MTPSASIVHRMDRRCRFRIREKRGDAEYFRNLETRLRECEGVRETSSNATTGSVLVIHDAALDDIIRYAESRGLFELGAVVSGLDPTLGELQEHLKLFDEELQRRSNGRWGLRTLTFYGLVAAAGYQMYRGNIFPAAESLLQHALGMLKQRRESS